MPSPTSPFRPSMRDTLQAVAPPTKDDDRQGRCAYPSKPCPNPRAVKLNGDCHNFCEFHRRKANMNQRRWQQRRRRMRSVGEGSASPVTPPSGTRSPASDELESARAVMMLQQADAGRYSPVPAHAWPRYPPVNQHDVWQRPAPMAVYPASYRNVNVLESTVPRAYSPPQNHSLGSMIPPLRSLPLPPLLPSVLAPLKASPPRTASFTC